MAPSSSTPVALLPKKELTPEQIERGITRLDERVTELQRFNVAIVPDGISPELSALSAAIRDTLDRCFGEGTAAFQRFVSATKLNWRPTVFTDTYPQRHHYQEKAQENIKAAVAMLQEAQRTLREDLTDVAYGSVLSSTPTIAAEPSNKVFVVHGHDDAAKERLARFLERIELEAVILHEQPDQGRTIIEKFEECAGQVGFAVVLLTPDDMGSAKSAPFQVTRARQNVVFELGYFVAKLGRGKVCLLRKGDIETPSDLYGVIYTDLDASDGWKMKLLRELKAAGLSFDANKVWS